MSKRNLLIGGRLFFAGLTLVAIATQFVSHLRHHFDPVNFFSYFTNLSNILAALVFVVGAVYLLRRRAPTAAEELIRGGVTVAMAIVGIVFFALLRDEDLGTLLPWVNVIVHGVMPVVVVADWFIQPPRMSIRPWQIGYWLIYPLLYLTFILIRGAVVGFYPYPFLNAAKAGGAGAVALYCVAICAVFLLVGWALIAASKALKRPASPPRTASDLEQHGWSV